MSDTWQRLRLALDNHRPVPRSPRSPSRRDGARSYRYDAEVTYALQGATLVMSLTMTNRGIRLPFGLGFHPWFVRDRDLRLTASCDHVWLENDDHLPKAVEPVSLHPDMNFNTAQPLPGRWINNWFSAWNRQAAIDWPSRGICARITASEALSQYVLFSPAADADFFCFEPVSHPVDAFNLEGGPEKYGMAALGPGSAIAATMKIMPRKLS
nr:hypothetical protein [Rhizobium sp. G21]